MTYELSEEVFKRGMLTRKAIGKIQTRLIQDKKYHNEYNTFEFYREQIEDFANSKYRTRRAEIIVTLDTIGWNGIFRADDIARILLHSEDRKIARYAALAKLAALEKAYEENQRKAAILRKGIEQVLPKTWQHEMSVSASGVNVRFYPPTRRDFVNVSVAGADEIYAFLQMILIVRPMLGSEHRKFDFDTFQTIANVWSMGTSTY